MKTIQWLATVADTRRQRPLRRALLRLGLIAALSAALAACGGGGGGGGGDSTDGGGSAPTALTVQATPLAGEYVEAGAPIVLAFSRAVNPASFSETAADLAADPHSGAWSDGDSVYTLTPASTWGLGTARKLTFTVDGLDGTTLGPINLEFHIVQANAVAYVRGDGNDVNPGTAAQPKRTVAAGIAQLAGAGVTRGVVRVATGTYSVASAIALVEGISLQGGWAADWSERSRIGYPTVLEDTRTAGGTATSPLRVVEATTGVTAQTRVEGFVISGSRGGGDTAGVYVLNSSPTLADNTIDGGWSSAGYASAVFISRSGGTVTPLVEGNDILGSSHGFSNGARGVYVYGSGAAPVIRGNTISGGYADTGNGVRGVLVSLSAGTIEDNTIVAGNVSNGSAVGIHLDGATTLVRHNQVSGGAVVGLYESLGIYAQNGAAPVIDGNDVFGGAANSTVGIKLWAADAFISGNTIHGGASASGVHGINIINASPVVVNNTIASGTTAGTAYQTAVSWEGAGPSHPRIDNNILFTLETANVWRMCIFHAHAPTDANNKPTSVRANVLVNCPKALYADNGILAGSIAAMQSHLGGNAVPTGGNVSEDPVFVDLDGSLTGTRDWRLTAESPLSVREGGLDLATLFAGYSVPLTDPDGAVRTDDSAGWGWSMGAFERD